ncbi:hypothetical protein CCACVL1_12688 [Corchorus capsularis]|uniref:K Homology domain-containing protein n=1 Tax=Corchorus capsularis TaxID=210143 RepID=A0A1R3IEC6_COCAP|nr:hypothetical protein CCACVL1_12688 [Corchorus capsularis]
MSTKVDQTSVIEPHIVSMSAKTNTSAASPTVSKVSMFAAKTGFVIPKNKLSGSLVPIFRGKKPGGHDTGTANEDNVNQAQRKTKWGPDLTQDASVIKGRALAYQTRVDQITKQLKSGNLDVRDNEDSPLAAQNSVKRSSDTQLDIEKSELLEIERREVIGEILKLNPSYKAPADYKPLLKEASVPIPVKEYPGYNFAGLIFGPGGDTKKRLEKETGAKVQVYGIKANSGEKVEISSPDGSEAQDAYEELYVHLSADTFEKVDGAVSLIEILVSSISGNIGSTLVPTSVSGNNVNVLNQTLDTAASSVTDTALIQGVPQLSQASPQGQFQYHSWFPPVPTPLNFSGPILNTPVPAQSSPANLPSLFGPQPAPAAEYNSFLQNSSFVSSSPQPPRQVLSQPYTPQMLPLGHTGPPRNFLVSNPNPLPTQPSPLSFSGSQPQPLGPLTSPRQSMPLFPQTSSVSSRPLQDHREVSAGSSVGWSGAPASLGLSNVGQVPHAVDPQPAVSSNSAAPPNMSVNFATGQFGPQVTSVPMNHPSMSVAPGPLLGSSHAVSAVLRPTAVSVPMPVPTPIRSSSPVISMAPSPSPSMNPAMVSRPISGNMANFAPINQPAAIGPRQHGSGDFSFQRHQAQGPASSMVPGSQAANPHALPPRSAVQPSFQFGVPNPQPMQVFPEPQTRNQMGFPNPNVMSAPPRHPAFPNAGPLATPTPVSQMGLRNFGPSPQSPNMVGPFPPRPGHPSQLQQHYPAPPMRPGNFMPPNPRFDSSPFPRSNRPMSGHAMGQQVYDPFSPTSAPIVPQQQGRGKPKARKQESDPEYEDLMASVGVK